MRVWARAGGGAGAPGQPSDGPGGAPTKKDMWKGCHPFRNAGTARCDEMRRVVP